MSRFCKVMFGGAILLVMGLAGCSPGSGATTRPVPSAVQWPPTPARAYLDLLQAGIQRARRQMPEITQSADQAAKRICAGGTIYAAGSQTDFVNELLTRAGGLMGIKAIAQAPRPRRLTANDVVLYGARGGLSIDDKIKIDQMRGQGAYVIGFASQRLSNDPYFQPDVLIDAGESEGVTLPGGPLICPTDSLRNVLDAWTWTGEFAAACTRRGKMPLFYESFHLPGGYERAAKYHSATMFHDDLTIKPIDPGVLGDLYLDQIKSCLDPLAHDSLSELAQAGQWLRQTDPREATALFEAHMFPQHFTDPRAPQPFGTMEEVPRRPRVPRAALVCVIGYQRPPQLLVDAARLRRFRLIYTSVERASDDENANVIYIDPRRPIMDGCVHVPGYDIPILPASGVMQAAIYWSIVAEAEAGS